MNARQVFALLTVVFGSMLFVHSAAAFSPPQVVSGSDNATGSPAPAADSATSRYVAWRRGVDSHVLVRRVQDDGAMGSALDVSGEVSKAGALPPVAVADPSGNVTVVWMRASDNHVVAVRIPQGGAPGNVIDVSQVSVASSSQSGAAADGLGNVHVVWRNGSNSHVTTRALAPNGGLGTVVDVSVIDGEAALWGTAPAVAADATGTAYFSYHRNTDCHIMLRSLSTGGLVGSALDISQTEFKAVGDTSPSVATAGSNVLVVWHRDGDINTHDDDTVYSSLVSGGVTPGAPVQISAFGDVSMMNVAAAGGPDGAFGIAWQGRTSGSVNHRPIDPNGQPSAAAQPLLASGSAADAAPGLSIGSTAGSTVAWNDASGEVSVVSTTGSWSPKPRAGKPKISFAKRSLKMRGGKLRLRLSCADADCKGTLRLKARRGTGTLGVTKFALAAGKSRTVAVKLNRRARAALRRSRTLKAKLAFSIEGGAPTTAAIKLRR